MRIELHHIPGVFTAGGLVMFGHRGWSARHSRMMASNRLLRGCTGSIPASGLALLETWRLRSSPMLARGYVYMNIGMQGLGGANIHQAGCRIFCSHGPFPQRPQHRRSICACVVEGEHERQQHVLHHRQPRYLFLATSMMFAAATCDAAACKPPSAQGWCQTLHIA